MINIIIIIVINSIIIFITTVILIFIITLVIDICIIDISSFLSVSLVAVTFVV